MKIKQLILFALFIFDLHFLYAQKKSDSHQPSIPSNVVPQGLGVNIHFTAPKPGEMEMLSEAGFKWVRMDFFWANIEKEKGVYDFSAYDGLVSSLNKHHIKALFILDYGNPLYDKGMAPHSTEAVNAFAKWAAASVSHFAGNGFLWEMWNEPNIGFWKPEPNVNDYIQLALATGKAIKNAAPGEAFIGPATSEIPLRFLESCFKAGLLQYWDAVSVHPYRRDDPETVLKDYKAVYKLIKKYAPDKKDIPVISSEWGYSAALPRFNEKKQGAMLAREFLTNLSYGIPLSIWYDWHNDGEDRKETEHNFGTVEYTYRSGKKQVYKPKPAYKAAKTLTHVLEGYHFEKRLRGNSKNDFILLFKKGRKKSYALWTTKRSHSISLRVKQKKYSLLDYEGEKLKAGKNTGKKMEIKLTDAPKYLIR